MTTPRRHLLRMALAVPALGLAGRTHAARIAFPAHKPILEISGKIQAFNDGETARFDRDMLEQLGVESFITATPWYSGPVTFEGIRMSALLDSVGASGDRLLVIALNDYTTEIPMTDLRAFGVLLALKRDGAYMPVRDKGPLFIVYPYDSRPELQQEKYYGRSAWQVAKIVVK